MGRCVCVVVVVVEVGGGRGGARRKNTSRPLLPELVLCCALVVNVALIDTFVRIRWQRFPYVCTSRALVVDRALVIA